MLTYKIKWIVKIPLLMEDAPAGLELYDLEQFILSYKWGFIPLIVEFFHLSMYYIFVYIPVLPPFLFFSLIMYIFFIIASLLITPIMDRYVYVNGYVSYLNNISKYYGLFSKKQKKIL